MPPAHPLTYPPCHWEPPPPSTAHHATAVRPCLPSPGQDRTKPQLTISSATGPAVQTDQPPTVTIQPSLPSKPPPTPSGDLEVPGQGRAGSVPSVTSALSPRLRNLGVPPVKLRAVATPRGLVVPGESVQTTQFVSPPYHVVDTGGTLADPGWPSHLVPGGGGEEREAEKAWPR